MNMAGSSFSDILCALVLIIVGALMLIHRNRLGAYTDYYMGRGGYVDKPTPGWMLIPFALALIAGGLVIILRSI